MHLSSKIALRYIFSKRSFNFITVITVISIIGITVGVAALVSVLSIFNGFQTITERQIVGFDPHLRIAPESGEKIKDVDKIIKIIENDKNISAYTPVVQGRVVAVTNEFMHVFTLNAIPPEHISYIDSIRDDLYMGSFDPGRKGSIIVGTALSNKLKLLPGDHLNLFSPELIESSIRSYNMASPVKTKLTGIFQTNIRDYDIQYGYSDLSSARKLFKTSGYNYIDIRLKNIDKLDARLDDLSNVLPEGFKILSWKDLNRDLYNIMQFERMASFIIMSIIIVIAVFNIFASLTMTVVEKQKDIAVLKSIGMTAKSIKNIFLKEGIFIGVISTIAGILLGLGLCYGQIHFKWFKVDTSKYIIDSIPVVINYSDIFIIALFSMILSALTTIYPAKKAAEGKIIESLRSE